MTAWNPEAVRNGRGVLKWLGVVLLWPALLFFSPVLLLLAESRMLHQQEADADRLMAAAPRALFTPVRVSGGSQPWDGRYLAGGWLDSAQIWTKLDEAGWKRTEQFGTVRLFRRQDERLEAICRKFSVLFDVCDLKTSRVGSAP